MALFKTIRGVMGSLFQVGGPAGNQVKNAANAIEIRNNDDSAYQNLNALKADGSDVNHVTTYQNLRDSDALIEFSFDGGSAPAAGTNTGQYGFCHTSGGSYTAGEVCYDDGSSLTAIPIKKGSKIATTSSVSGTVSLIANGLYIATAAAAPFSWTLKGDGSTAATLKTIELSLGTNATYSSTTAIPDGSKIMEVHLDVDASYDNSATIQVIVDGTSDLTILDTDENDPETVGTYSVEPLSDVDASTEGVVTINISNTPTTGAATAYIRYAESFLG